MCVCLIVLEPTELFVTNSSTLLRRRCEPNNITTVDTFSSVGEFYSTILSHISGPLAYQCPPPPVGNPTQLSTNSLTGSLCGLVLISLSALTHTKKTCRRRNVATIRSARIKTDGDTHGFYCD